MSRVHPLIEGIDAIGDHYRALSECDGLFESIYERIRANWLAKREPDRWPTPTKNWVLRVAPEFTPDPSHRLEKQLQKQIAISLGDEGWGNDVPTASGLLDGNARQMNVDLAHQIGDGFEFIELKVDSNTPYDAALQILRYGAIYMLYRLEPELSRRFDMHVMMRAKWIALEVLAPHSYYDVQDVGLPTLEDQLNRQLEEFAKRYAAGVDMSFYFTAFPAKFVYAPGADCASVRSAMHGRVSPFAKTVQISGCGGVYIRSFGDWEQFALPPERKRHWKEGRSACELGRVWTASGEPRMPLELSLLLNSLGETMGAVVRSGITEHETTLPFGVRGPRCHDLALQAARDAHAMTICIEAKADESFGGTVSEELEKARHRPVTKFPERLDWLTRSLLGIPAFSGNEHRVLSEVIAQLPYQLFAAIAGTLLEAQLRKATMAVFVVHEFRTAATVDAKLEANAKALNRFLRLFQSANDGAIDDFQLQDGQLIGPIWIVERPTSGAARLPSDIPLFIGKIRTDRIGM